jgi:hypothetical protein
MMGRIPIQPPPRKGKGSFGVCGGMVSQARFLLLPLPGGGRVGGHQ